MASKLAKLIKQSKPFVHIEEELSLALFKVSYDLESELIRAIKIEGLSGPQYNILRILRGAGDEGLACSALSKRLLVKAPDITRLLDRMEKLELISRQREVQDRRVVIARISQTGLESLERLDSPLSDMQKLHFQNLKDQEKEQLIDLLNKLYELN